MIRFSTTRSLALSLLLCGAMLAAHAQHGGGGSMGGGGMGRGGGMGMPGGDHGGMRLPGMSEGNIPRGTPPPGSAGSPNSSIRGGLQLGPPGRWWDDRKFAKSLGLNGDQQKRMDGIFSQNRDALLSRYQNLQTAESRLEALTRMDKPSEPALFTEIDHVAQARAELEKVNTHMLLQLRDEMTPEQIGKLDDHR